MLVSFAEADRFHKSFWSVGVIWLLACLCDLCAPGDTSGGIRLVSELFLGAGGWTMEGEQRGGVETYSSICMHVLALQLEAAFNSHYHI